MTAVQPEVYIFWDNSNIFISALAVGAKREGFFSHNVLRIDFRKLLHLAHADRPVARAFAAGSIPPELREVWDRLQEAGVEVELQERGSESHTEQGIDARLQVAMLREMADNSPQIAVLLTGDGAGYADNKGFHADLERMERKGWAYCTPEIARHL